MKAGMKLLAALLVAAALSPLVAQAPQVSEKKDVAIFALGYYGYNIPEQTLGNIDMEIQKVFVDLGRFNILGYTQRLSSGGLQEFIETLKKAKEANFSMPEKYQFGEAILTEADFNKLVGAFIVAAPVVANFNSSFNSKTGYWETEIKTNVTFVDVAGGGSVMAIAQITTTGLDKQDENKSISAAIEGIPMQLQYEIRKIPAFQINTRILAVSGSEIKMQLGQNMGIQKGDEYSVIVGGMVEGFKDESEKGLVIIKEVGAEVSTGLVLYSSAKLTKDIQLREIARLGVDAEPFVHLVSGTKLDYSGGSSGSNIIIGARVPLTRGFFDMRPFASLQIPVNGIGTWGTFFMVPINAIVGAEYNIYLGRLTLAPYAGAGVSYIYAGEATSGTTTDTSDSFFSHYGAQAYVRVSFLVTRDIKIFAEAGGEYWFAASTIYSTYGGIGYGGGVSLKM